MVLADSHTELPTDERDLDEIRRQDLVPFAGCINSLDAIMPAHIVYPKIDQHCAGFSRVWIQELLRKELGFDGVVFSDDLTMNAAHSAGSWPSVPIWHWRRAAIWCWSAMTTTSRRFSCLSRQEAAVR